MDCTLENENSIDISDSCDTIGLSNIDEEIFNYNKESILQEKTVEDLKMKIINNSLVLYIGLNRNNAILFSQGKYNKGLIAYEYPEYAMATEQAECIVAVAYNTIGLYDTLTDTASNEISNIVGEIIKKTKNSKNSNNKKTKSTMEDNDILRVLMNTKNITGIRVHYIDNMQKAYSNTHMFFGKSHIRYYLKPGSAIFLHDETAKLNNLHLNHN